LFEVVPGFRGLSGDVVDGVGDGGRGSGQFLGGCGGLGDCRTLVSGGGGQLIGGGRQLRRRRIHLRTGGGGLVCETSQFPGLPNAEKQCGSDGNGNSDRDQEDGALALVGDGSAQSVGLA